MISGRRCAGIIGLDIANLVKSIPIQDISVTFDTIFSISPFLWLNGSQNVISKYSMLGIESLSFVKKITLLSFKSKGISKGVKSRCYIFRNMWMWWSVSGNVSMRVFMCLEVLLSTQSATVIRISQQALLNGYLPELAISISFIWSESLVKALKV